MRVLIALLALIVLVGCTTPPTTNIESPQTAGVRTCIDLDENGLCDDIEKKAPVEAPKPIVEEKVEVEVPVEAPIAPKPVTVAEPKVSEPEVSEVRKTEPKATAKSYLAPFEGEKTFIILDSERNKGGAVAASSDIIAYFGFPKTLKVDAIDTYSGTVDDYSDNLIFLGNACANGFTADLYEIKEADCADQFAEQTGEIRTFESNGKDVLVIAGSDDTVVRNIVKLLVAGTIKNTGSRQSIDLSDY